MRSLSEGQNTHEGGLPLLVYRLGASPRSATSALPVTSTQFTASPRGPGIPITRENTRDGAAPAGGRNIRDRICEGEGRCTVVEGQGRGKVDLDIQKGLCVGGMAELQGATQPNSLFCKCRHSISITRLSSHASRSHPTVITLRVHPCPVCGTVYTVRQRA